MTNKWKITPATMDYVYVKHTWKEMKILILMIMNLYQTEKLNIKMHQNSWWCRYAN